MQQSFKQQIPTLYMVSTPIGNLKDMTYRAVEILKEVDYILAEDTRTSSVLLNHYQIKKPMISYHDFNKEEQESKIIELLKEGKNLALISDAGTPGISDPGYEITQRVINEGFYVVSVPGASAILTALISSGLPMQPFTFIGFLPRKKTQILEALEQLKYRNETLIFYESPMRISKTLQFMHETLGNRKITIARELTKTFETYIRTDLSKAILMEHDLRGEYVIVLEGYQADSSLTSESVEDHYLRYIKLGLREKDAMKQVALDRSMKKSEIYQIIKINDK